jgi:hypothetical protein
MLFKKQLSPKERDKVRQLIGAQAKWLGECQRTSRKADTNIELYCHKARSFLADALYALDMGVTKHLHEFLDGADQCIFMLEKLTVGRRAARTEGGL